MSRETDRERHVQDSLYSNRGRLNELENGENIQVYELGYNAHTRRKQHGHCENLRQDAHTPFEMMSDTQGNVRHEKRECYLCKSLTSFLLLRLLMG